MDKSLHLIEVVIWEPIPPLDREERYEQPLNTALESCSLGELTGAGSLLDAAGEIKYVNLEIEVGDIEKAVPLITEALTSAGAPRGSELKYSLEGIEFKVPFGETECLAIYLDGVGLDHSVYSSSSIDELADQLWAAISGLRYKEIRWSWQGPTETALYLFSENAEELDALIRPILWGYPLCQNSRIIVRHGSPNLPARTYRTPTWPKS